MPSILTSCPLRSGFVRGGIAARGSSTVGRRGRTAAVPAVEGLSPMRLVHWAAPAAPWRGRTLLARSETFGGEWRGSILRGRRRLQWRLHLREGILRNERLRLVLVVDRPFEEARRLLGQELAGVLDSVVIVIVIVMELLPVKAATVHGRQIHFAYRAILCLRRQDDAVVVLRMLKIILGRDRVAG